MLLHMKASILLSAICFCTHALLCQNLVPNPSFENHKTCDFITGAIDTSILNPLVVNDWASANASGFPDYFHPCQIYNAFHPNAVSVPINSSGSQYARTGNAYTGIANHSLFTPAIEWREYIQTKLTQKLSKGVTYCIGFYTVFAEQDTAKKYSAPLLLSSKNWGLFLSPNRPFNATYAGTNSPPTAFIVPGNPQLKVTEFISDTTNWTLISGLYTANGDEEWLTIGNFHAPSQTPLDTVWKDNTSFYPLSYYFIDDVFVIPSNSGQILPNDTTYCAASFPIDILAQTGFTQYVWSTGDTTVTTTAAQAGTYQITAQYEGCAISDTISIGIKPPPVLDLPTLQLCENVLPQTYAIADSTQFNTFQWSGGQQSALIDITSTSDLILMASGDCGDAQDTLRIVIDTVPIVNLGIDRSLCENGQSSEIVLANLAGLLPEYTWSNGSSTPQISVRDGGTYTLATQNACGTFSDEVTLIDCPPMIYVPNVFSPSAIEFENSRFRPFIANGEILTLDIYDRWGGHVYNHMGNDAVWDGKWKEKMASDGVYVYVISYRSLYETGIKSIEGSVLLLHR
jgi:CHU_C Type IX secretion signal domain